MVFYITKHALTQGIIEIDSSAVAQTKVEHGRLITIDRTLRITSYPAGEWHSDKESAVTDAERRRQKKIASLKAQLAKLENLSFR